MRWVDCEMHGWGRYPTLKAEVMRPENLQDLRTEFGAVNGAGEAGFLAHGLGRSYGDAALLENGRLVLTTRLDRMLSFDGDSGILRCEAGVTLAEIIDVFLPQGYFPAVVPGTKFVTVGGAIANDIHGKGHHADGTFTDHVQSMEMMLASGEVTTASRHENPDLFHATVAGLGLTGLILAAEITLKKVAGPWLETESIRVKDLDEFFEISAESKHFPQVVTWIDCLAKGDQLGRGLVTRGRHAEVSEQAGATVGKRSLLSKLPDSLSTVPVDLPNFALNPLTLKLFNEAFYRRQRKKRVEGLLHYEPWFFPLDAVGDWNRAYGKRGMIQYQIVVPPDPEHRAVRSIVERIARSGFGSFLTVIKEFGDRDNGGLSFPMPGVTLALDFPNYGKELFRVLDQVDRMVVDAGGRVYLGKDARLSADLFREMYPHWQEWKEVRDRFDPDGLFQSNLGQRLGLVSGRAASVGQDGQPSHGIA